MRKRYGFVAGAVLLVLGALAVVQAMSKSVPIEARPIEDATEIGTRDLPVIEPPPASNPAAVEERAPESANGTLVLTTTPAGAEVALGDQILGRTPLRAELSAGVEHRLSIRLEGYVQTSVPVRLRPNEEWKRHIDLNPIPKARVAQPSLPPPRRAPPPPPAPAPDHGFVSIDTEPWTMVLRDGETLGTTPLFKVKLPAGKQRLQFKNVGQKIDAERIVNVQPGKVTKVRYDLR